MGHDPFAAAARQIPYPPDVRTSPRATPTVMLAVMAVTDDALLAALRGPDRDAAVAELHALLLRAARFELAPAPARCPRRGSTTSPCRRPTTRWSRSSRKLDDFRGASRFTTWAYKFALLEAGVKAAPARLAGPRGRRSTPSAGRASPTPAPSAARAARARASSCGAAARRVARRADAAPARGVRRARAQRRPDRRARRAARHDARRALQDAARRPPQAARAEARQPEGRPMSRSTRSHRRCSARPGRRSAARSASSSSTSTSSSSSPARTPTPRVPGMRAHLEGCPPAARTTRACASWSASDRSRDRGGKTSRPRRRHQTAA